MLKYISKFPDYVTQGYELGKDFKIKGKVNKIIVCGMGGSGISGCLLKDYAHSLPVFVNMDYDIPDFVDKKTLAIVISYSGNTEETLSAYKKVKEKTENLLLISSGGILGKEENVVNAPKGLPPRYSLPFLFFPMLSVLNNSNILKKDFDIDELVKNLKSIDKKEAESLAKKIGSKIPLVYATHAYASVAYRWQTQFNENSKVFAHSHFFSEHNHNEIEAELDDKFLPIMIRDSDAHERINLRMDFIAKKINPEQIELKGESRLSKMFYGILFGDFVTCYLALARGVNPGAQDNIDALKKMLSD